MNALLNVMFSVDLFATIDVTVTACANRIDPLPIKNDVFVKLFAVPGSVDIHKSILSRRSFSKRDSFEPFAPTIRTPYAPVDVILIATNVLLWLPPSRLIPSALQPKDWMRMSENVLFIADVSMKIP